jgi:hypothetical protein
MKHTDKVPGLTAKARALEDSFFADENARLLQKLREASVREEKKREFRHLLMIKKEDVLEALVDLGVEPETLIAFSLVPLVEVAWADGEIQPKEREAIIRAAVERGVEEGSATADLLRNWLTTKPDAKLLVTWRGYIEELMGALNEGSARELKSSVIGRARAVAEAAGGFLGVGSISAAEKKKLDELEWAFG